MSLDTIDLFERRLKDNVGHFFFSERFQGALMQIWKSPYMFVFI